MNITDEAMTTITDTRLAEMVGAGVPCVPAQPGEIAAVVQELRRLRADWLVDHLTACQQEVERMRAELIKSRNYWSEQCSSLHRRNAELVKALEKLTRLYEQEFDPETLKRPDWLVAALGGQSNEA